MYTTTTTSREKALLAAAAARRVMKREMCSKSQCEFKCFSCGEMIHRGDKITRCHGAPKDGMTLRFRGADCQNGIAMAETAFYQPQTGTRNWVHVGCNPCYWDEGFDNGDESSPPSLRGVHTEWGCKVDREFEDWTSGPGGESWLIMGVPYFLKVKGYPKEKSMKTRIVHAVTRFQAIWRGFIYKVAYPAALLQAQAEQMYPHEMEVAVCEEIDLASAYINKRWLQSEEGCKNEHDEIDTDHAYRKVWHAREDAENARERNEFLRNNSIGEHLEVLMDERYSNGAIYSAEIVNHTKKALIATDDLYFWVRYHHDDEVRKYHWKRLRTLKLECDAFKSKHGIIAKIIGKLPLYILSRYR